MDVQELEQRLKDSQDFGLYHIILFSLQVLAASFHGMQTSSSNFISPTIDHFCRISDIQHLNTSYQKYVAIPLDDDGEYEQCLQYDLPWGNYSASDFENWDRSTIEISATIECSSWVFDSGDLGWTRTEKDASVCSNLFMKDLPSTLFVAGLALGSAIGPVGDFVGRKFLAFFMIAIHALGAFGTALFSPVVVFCICRFLCGLGNRGVMIATMILCSEIFSSKYRAIHACSIRIASACGILLCAMFAYIVQNYSHLFIIIGCLISTTMVFLFFVNESPVWLSHKDKHEKALHILKKIAKINNKVEPQVQHPNNTSHNDIGNNVEKVEPQVEPQLQNNTSHNDIGNNVENLKSTTFQKEKDSSKSEKDLTFFDIFRYRHLRRTTIIIHYLWIGANFIYFSVTMTVGELFGDVYINVLMSGLLDIPVAFLNIFLFSRYGRRPVLIWAYVLATIFCALTIPMDIFDETQPVATAMVLLCRAGLSLAYGCLNLITAELFPTSVRQTGLATCSGFSSLMAIAGPYIGGSLRSMWRPLPSVIYTIFLLPTPIIAFWIPETADRPMPATFQEADDLSRNPRSSGVKKSQQCEISIHVVSDTTYM